MIRRKVLKVNGYQTGKMLAMALKARPWRWSIWKSRRNAAAIKLYRARSDGADDLHSDCGGLVARRFLPPASGDVRRGSYRAQRDEITSGGRMTFVNLSSCWRLHLAFLIWPDRYR